MTMCVAHLLMMSLQMTSAHLIRKEDRESVFKAILLHHNYENLKLVINVEAKNIFGSSQSMRSDKSDFVDLLRTPRLNTRRRTSNVLHPSEMGMLNPIKIFGEGVSKRE